MGGRDERLQAVCKKYDFKVAMSQTQSLSADQVALLTSADVDRMPSEVYKIHVSTNPAFVTRVNELAITEKRKPR